MTLHQQRKLEELRALPATGWVGRRNRAVLVLSQMAGLSDEDIALLTAGDVKIADGTATITTPTGNITLAASEDVLGCGPCALARWLRVLEMTATYPDRYVIDSVIARAASLSANSPHLCGGSYAVAQPTRQMQLLPPIDRWGLISALPAHSGLRNRHPARTHGHRSGPSRVHRPPGTRGPAGD